MQYWSELCRAGTEKVKYMESRLIDCVISSVKTCTSDPRVSFPMELLRIAYGKIEWAYTL